MASRGDIKFDEVQPKLKGNWLKLGFEETLDKTGSFTKLKSKEYFDEGDYPVIDQGDSFISGYVNDEKLLYKGELPVVIFGDHTRVVKYIDFEFATGADGTKVLKPFSVFDSMFFYYYMKSLKIPSLGYSRHFKILKQVSVPLPPLKEQQRIVAKLDTLFTHLEVLNTRLANIPKLLKNFKQAVLTQAVMGKLTEEWRVGKELDEWEEKALQDITTKIGSGSTPRGGSENYKEEGIPLVRSMNIHFNGIKLKGLAFIDEVQAERLKNVIIEENDILLNITGASIGRVCIAEEDVIGGRVNQHVTIIRLSECHSSEYINMYLASSIIQNYIFNENYGVTRQALTKTQTQNLEINLPPQEEQTEIVKRVENLFTKADKIEAQYKILKAKTESLPQAILAKAFKGELVEQLDTDGSAKELLAEIQKLKAAVIPKKKTKKKVKV